MNETSDLNPYESPGVPTGDVAGGNTVTVDPETMYRAHRIHQGHYAVLYRVVAAMLGIVGLGYATGVMMGGRFFVATVITLAATMLLMRALLAGQLLRRTVRKHFQQMGVGQEIVTYEPHVDRLRIVTDNADGSIAWSAFTKWKEQDGLILAYRHDKLFQVIPIAKLDDAAAGDIRRKLTAHSRRC